MENIEEEQWVPFKGEPSYLVSNFGNIRNKDSNINSIFYIDKDGYYIKSIEDKRYRVNRVVAIHFVYNPNPKKYKIVNHKDEDKLNNRYDNVEWCDDYYNNNYGTKNQKCSETLTKAKIIKYDLIGNQLTIYNNGVDLANKIKVSGGILSALTKNGFNRYFYGHYYFYDYEKFDINRVVIQRVYEVYNDKLELINTGDRRTIANGLKLNVKQFANNINYYHSKNRDIVINGYTIKIVN